MPEFSGRRRATPAPKGAKELATHLRQHHGEVVSDARAAAVREQHDRGHSRGGGANHDHED